MVMTRADDATVPMLLRTARRTYAAAIRAELRSAGLGDLPLNGQYAIRAVQRSDAPLSDIARDLAVSKQAASKLIEQLVVRGFLERTPGTFDRRRITLKLTSRGRRAAKVIESGTSHVDAALAAALSAAQLAGFHAGLDALVALHEKYVTTDE